MYELKITRNINYPRNFKQQYITSNPLKKKKTRDNNNDINNNKNKYTLREVLNGNRLTYCSFLFLISYLRAPLANIYGKRGHSDKSVFNKMEAMEGWR